MYTIAHILPYFLNGTGKWPEYIDWYMASCKANNTIDFYIFTDDHSLEKWEKEDNITIIYMTFEQCIQRIHEKLGEVNISRPYKMCDLRHAYFEIFEEWIKGYDFWAFGDCDLIFGNIREFFPDNFLDQYDRFQVLGNLQIIRNTEEVNKQYLLNRPEGSPHKDLIWENVKKCESNCMFDEWDGVPLLVRENGKRIYWTRENFANMYQPTRYKKMIDNTVQENTLFQYWKWENGRIYHVDALLGKEKPRLYIHMSARKMKTVPYNGEQKVYLTVNSEIKLSIQRWKDSYCGFEFFKVYFKKICIWITWHVKHLFKQ